MGMRHIRDVATVNTDASGVFSFTVDLPAGYPNVLYGHLGAGLSSAGNTPCVVAEHVASPSVGTVDGWNGVHYVQFRGVSDVVSGSIVVKFHLLIADDPLDVSASGENFQGALTQP